MKVVLFVALLSVSAPAVVRAQAARQRAAAPAASEKVGTAYEQFLLAHRLEQQNDVDGAIAAYKRAIDLDPTASDIPAELAGLYLRQSRAGEAMTAAEQSLAINPDNQEANRVLGTVYAALADAAREGGNAARNTQAINENIAKAIRYLERAVDQATGQPNPNVLATLARLYVGAGSYDKAIPILTDLVGREPDWQEGTTLLVNAYLGAGRNTEAIAWLEPAAAGDPRLLPTLGDLYERAQQWKEAAQTYEMAVQRAPRNFDLKSRYASVLMTLGGHDDLVKARATLQEVVGARSTDARALYLLSQSQRRLGDAEAEATARRLIALQNGQSPWGYYALAEALEEHGDYKAVVDALTPEITSARTRSDSTSELSLLLPHVGFAHQELGEYDRAISAFEEAHQLAPTDPAIAGDLIEANIAAKKFDAAVQVAKQALTSRPEDLRLMRLQAQALRQDGKADQAIALLEKAVSTHANDPQAYVALAQIYADASRGPQALKVLKDADAKFPSNTTVLFELGSVLEKQKNYAGAEAAFRQVIAKEPGHAAALNYLGYMLADRGDRLDESVTLVKRALEVEPNNGSFLDSLGWAYYKADKLDLAEANLHRAAAQLKTNSVIQDHYAAVLFKLGRYDDAIASWTQSLAGDGDSIDRADIDKKIRAARQKLPKK